jgi:hypothetical protein
MANTSSRALRHLSLLQTHRYRPGAELAERLDVSLRTLRRSWTRTFDRATSTSLHQLQGYEWPIGIGAELQQLCRRTERASIGRYCSHQQYLYKNPNGYRCHSNTGVPFPSDAS